MADAERVLMQGTARGLALERDRIHGGSSTAEQLTVEDVGWALAGMRAAGIPEVVCKRVGAALGARALGDPQARWDLYCELQRHVQRAISKGRWPERVDGRVYHDTLPTLAIYAEMTPALDGHLSGNGSTVWFRELMPKYAELRGLMDEWFSVGLGHVHHRTRER